MEGNYVYILKCRDGSLYTGWTTDLDNRLAAHNSGRGAKYTRGRRPVELVYHEVLPSRGEALRREADIKKLRRAEKEALIAAGKRDGGGHR
ncbi:MAG: GIY-YIG nuclease family protein [Eubacterium sp.]|nr:GIY-YIG nuclease family protein [Eubacterium sp.]